MPIRYPHWLALSVFFVALPGTFNAAESKTQTEKITQTEKKQANIDGFRSAKFGMREKEIYKAISKDFKISKRKVKEKKNTLEKTKSLAITIPKLLEMGGPATITYILGHSSKKLEVVNILWGFGVTDKPDPQGIVDAANFLRNHFLKKQYKKGVVANYKLDDTMTIVFRGRDKKNRMAVLTLNAPKKEDAAGESKARKDIILKLSYLLHPDNPDILKIKDGDF